MVMGLNGELTSDSISYLDELLSEMNYLGRSESWVKAAIAESEIGDPMELCAS